MQYRRIIGIIGAAVVAAMVLQIPLLRRSGIKAWHMTAKADPIPAVVRSLHPVYPYSVIPGGVYSVAELTRVLANDRLVREHYAGAAAHLVTTAEVRYAYVSYRLGGRLLWTTHKLQIPRGETLLTDGVNFSRTRCGNRLSEFPHRETALIEPPIRLLSLPKFTQSFFVNEVVGLESPMVERGATTVPIIESRLAPVLPSSVALYESPLPAVQWFPVSLVAIPGPLIYPKGPNPKLLPLVQTLTHSEPDAPSEVPEPQTLALVLIALMGISGISVMRRKSRFTASGNPPRQ
jgi:hypothetical protein